MKETVLKILGITFSVIMIINFILLFTFRIQTLHFWIITGICAASAYFGIPYLKRKL